MSSDLFEQRIVRLASSRGGYLAHPDLKAKLVDDAASDGSNMTEVAVRVLSKRYGVIFIPSGRRAAAKEDSLVLQLRLPVELDRALGVAAAMHGWTIQDEIRAALCAHYGLRVPARVKHPRRPRRGPSPAAA